MTAYATAAQATAYLTARGMDASGVTDAQLLRGSEYIDQAYGTRFPGVPQTNNAAWPRTGAVDAYGRPVTDVPQAVVNASIEAAYRIAQGNELLPDYKPTDAKVLTKVGPIEFTPVSGVAPDQASIPVVPAIDRMLAPFLGAPCVPIMLVR